MFALRNNRLSSSSSSSSLSSSETGVRFLQHSTLLQGILYLVYSGLWFVYLSQLSHTPDSKPTFCRDISPTLRTVLLVVAWIKVISMALYMCAMVSTWLIQPTMETLILLIAHVIILGIFVYQIQYLNAVGESGLLDTQCDEIESEKRRTVMSFNSVVFLFGAVLIVFGLTGQTVMRKMIAPHTLPSAKKKNKKNKKNTRRLSKPYTDRQTNAIL